MELYLGCSVRTLAAAPLMLSFLSSHTSSTVSKGWWQRCGARLWASHCVLSRPLEKIATLKGVFMGPSARDSDGGYPSSSRDVAGVSATYPHPQILWDSHLVLCLVLEALCDCIAGLFVLGLCLLS